MPASGLNPFSRPCHRLRNETTTGVPTTTTSLPAAVSVSVPASEAQEGNLAVYTDEAGRLMLVGPTVGWTCNGSFGADGSGFLALAPVGTAVPAGAPEYSEVLEWLQDKPALKNMPVVVLSSSVILADRERAMQLGAREYVTKTDYNELAKILGSLIARFLVD